MKSKHFITPILALLLGIFALSSCSDGENSYENKSYLAGDLMSQEIIDTYLQAYSKLNYANSYQQELANILKGDAIDSVSISPVILVEDFEVKVNLFTAYRDLMFEMQSKTAIENQNVKNKINTVLNFIDSLYNEDLDTKSGEIREYVSAYKFDLDIAIYELSNLVFQVYDNDVKYWMITLNKEYNKYASTVDSIPASVFDEEKLEKYVYEPYKDKETLVNIYKLNMKQDAYEQKTKFIDKSTSMQAIFNSLRNAFKNISEDNNQTDLNYYLVEQIISQLKTYTSEAE